MEKIKVLLVEDDENKMLQIASHISAVLPRPEVSLERSFQAGLEAVLERTFNLVLLDMTLPTFEISVDEEGGRPRPFGGREILEHMEENEIVTPVIVVTQYVSFEDSKNKKSLDDLDQELKERFPSTYYGSVYYHIGMQDWKQKLRDRLISVIGDVNG